MLYGLLSSCGSFFLFSSFILNLFIVIGQLSNKPFINRLYFAQVSQQATGQNYNLGLWNYCTSTTEGVESCTHPDPGYNWINTPGVNQAITSARYSSGLFLGLFILLIIGLCFTFLLLIASLPLCCVRARSVGATMSTLIFITFLVMLAALIIELVVIIRGNQLLHQADPTWTGHAGNSLWMTIGSVASLLFAFISYGCSCCAVPTDDGEPKKSRGKVDPYGDKHDTEDGGAVRHSPYILNQSIYHTAQPQQQQTSNMQHLNQPYNPDTGMAAGTGSYAPVVSPQGFEHQPRYGNMGSPGGAIGQQQPYQTPVLQHSDANNNAGYN